MNYLSSLEIQLKRAGIFISPTVFLTFVFIMSLVGTIITLILSFSAIGAIFSFFLAPVLSGVYLRVKANRSLQKATSDMPEFLHNVSKSL